MNSCVSYHLDARLILINDLTINMHGKDYIDYIKIYINSPETQQCDNSKYLDYKSLDPEDFYKLKNASAHLPIIIIKFNNHIPDKDTMLKIASKKIDYLLNILFLDYNIELFAYVRDLAIFKGENVNTWAMEIQETYPLDMNSLNDLADKLKEHSVSAEYSSLYDNYHIKLYANALKAKDPEIQLTLLYSLLMILIGGSKQKDIDEFLKSKGYLKERESTKEKNKFQESLITWLRNVVGHTQIDYKEKYKSDWEDIMREFREENNELKKIVSETIKDNYQNK